MGQENGPARAAHFPRRNRILAGLVERLIVMQAPARSGALISARFALECGRDVIVFDHELFRSFAGSNAGAQALLEEGALPLIVPGLEADLIQEPAYHPETRERRLALWKAATLGRGLRWLGGRSYLRLSGSFDVA